MDRAELQALLAEGLSLAEIGRRHGLHESTVGYWAKKHGLKAAQQEKHAARGGLMREELEALVEAGATIEQIAKAVDRSKSTVRHWLREFGLQTQQARRIPHDEREKRILRKCVRHGLTEFQRRESGGYRCLKCRSEAVSRRRRLVKLLLVREAGGACRVCGYDRCARALHFHHIDPAHKLFNLSLRGVTRSLEQARAEAQKCILLCSNCHAEVEEGIIDLDL
jgi:transposase